MTSKRVRPPAATGDLGICHRQAASDKPEFSSPSSATQDRRAVWLARRFHLSLSTAGAVAGLAFPQREGAR